SKDPSSLVRPEIRALCAYHVAPAKDMVKLDAMENPYPLPAGLAAEMGARLRDAMQIPEHLDLLLGNGSDEVLQVIAMAIARPGAVALAPEPSFAMYR